MTENIEPPREILNNPEAVLAWNGLVISITNGGITRKDAYRIVTGKEIEVPERVPNDPKDPRFWEFWNSVRELTCPEETFYDTDG